MRLLKTAIVLGASSLTLLVAACSGAAPTSATATASTAGAAAGGASTVALKLEDIKFDTTALSATKGQALTVNLTNTGALDHDFTMEKLDGAATIDGKDAKATGQAVHAALKPKATGKLVITPSAAGTFTFFCTVPGHREAGMQGRLTVK